MERYSTKYTDAKGSEFTFIENDGETLRLTVRGVQFVGRDFDNLEPAANTSVADLASFEIYKGDLCSCRLEFTMPVSVSEHGVVKTANLLVDMQLDTLQPDGSLSDLRIQASLPLGGSTFVSGGHSGWFEDELLEIQRQLPSGVFLRACITCLFSDYSPLGHALFGDMMCFRNIKSEYLKVQSKQDFTAVHSRFERSVQETYLCSEYARRIPGTGYRG